MKHLNNYLDFFSLLMEQKADDQKIYNLPKDPYEYKVEEDNWLARRKGTQKWFSITGKDFKDAYQKSINTLDQKFPQARTEGAPKKEGAQKKEAPKEVEYTRDNGEKATGTIVDVDADKETVTIKGAESGKEFEKPFDDVEMEDSELKQIAKEEEKPAAQEKPAEPADKEKTEEKPAEPSEDNQQRVLKSSQDNPPQGLKQFFLADDKAIEYMKDEGADISANGKTYVFPFPPNDKEEFVYLSGYNTDEEKIGRIYVGKIGPASDVATFDGKEQLQDAVNTANDMKKEMGDSTPQQKTTPQAKPETGQVDQQARAKSKAADELEDKLSK